MKYIIGTVETHQPIEGVDWTVCLVHSIKYIMDFENDEQAASFAQSVEADGFVGLADREWRRSVFFGGNVLASICL